jgi:2-hydroxy-6-oxonona-2,4-dienedioate hydrolase
VNNMRMAEAKRRSIVVMSESSNNLASIWPLVNGWRIHTRVSTRKTLTSALPVVFVHGLGVSGRYMAPTAERLANYHPVLAPDLLGFGLSDKPARVLNVREMSEEVAAWLDVLGVARAAFLGNSLGCQVIVDLAVRHPNLVDRAILVGPTVDRVGRTMPRQIVRGCRDLWGEPWSLWRILAADYLVAGTRRMYQTLRDALEDPVEQKFPLMQAPTLLVRGSRDPIAPQRWIEEILALLPRGRATVIPGATHAANYSAPDALVKVTCEFLKESSVT